MHPLLPHSSVLGEKEGYFEKMSLGSETLDMTSEGLEEMFEGDFADTCAKKNSAHVDGGPSGGS